MITLNGSPARSLHYVLKIADRSKTVDFLVDTLGMQVLRHEEFEAGCEASCNGPYDGKWSKTMIGYGPEDENFVLELTYNYSVKHYEVGNDFCGIRVSSSKVLRDIKSKGMGKSQEDGGVKVESPDGYSFIVAEGERPDLSEVTFNVSDLDRSLAFWCSFLGFNRVDDNKESLGPKTALIRSTGKIPSTTIRLQQLPENETIRRGTGYGRIAFACPGDSLEALQRDVIAAGYTVHTAYVSLETPGKATVQVVILQDPDGLEICFVGENGFRELSVVDPAAPRLLAEAIKSDKSVEWEARRERMEAMMQAKGV